MPAFKFSSTSVYLSCSIISNCRRYGAQGRAKYAQHVWSREHYSVKGENILTNRVSEFIRKKANQLCCNFVALSRRPREK